jgi:AbrB family looped-hinge helix DNA binding protein
MIEISTVSTKGQVVIPESFRKKLEISPGKRIVFRENEGKLLIELEDSFLQRMAELEEKKDWEKIGLQQMAKDGDNEADEQWNQFL